jgi:hypothetical protein
VSDLDQEMLGLIAESLDPSVLAQFAREDLGWRRLDTYDEELFQREYLLRESRRARLMSIADPLLRRAVNLRIAYVWATGCEISADQEEDAEQDVNAVVQAFLDDPSNQDTFSSSQAHEEQERRFATDGNSFRCMPTDPLTGRVQVRLIPYREITDIVCDPEDAKTPWFYKREYTAQVVEAGFAGTRTRREQRTVYYPALNYRPRQRPRTINGKAVEWNAPVLHRAVNRVDGSKWGAPDLLAAIPWALGYKEFLEDWARLVKALSKLAFKTTVKGRNAPAVRDTLATNGIGGTALLGEGQSLEAIGKSGATIDSGSGRPLGAMVASATDVPVTMLLADPGVTGARATAETLDQPLQLWTSLRREFHAEEIRLILTYVVEQAVRAPRGQLKGTVKLDPFTGREIVALKGDQEWGLNVDWASIDKVPLDVLVKAITEADGTQLLPELVIAKQLLIALDVDDIDEVLANLVDDNGDYVAPRDATAARSQQDAVAAGNLPGQTTEPPPDAGAQSAE